MADIIANLADLGTRYDAAFTAGFHHPNAAARPALSPGGSKIAEPANPTNPPHSHWPKFTLFRAPPAPAVQEPLANPPPPKFFAEKFPAPILGPK